MGIIIAIIVIAILFMLAGSTDQQKISGQDKVKQVTGGAKDIAASGVYFGAGLAVTGYEKVKEKLSKDSDKPAAPKPVKF